MTNYLPKIYKEMELEFPKVAKAYDKLASECHAAGPLDTKTRRLVKLGIAIGLISEGGIRSHARKGLAEGITAKELRHAVLLALTTTGFPAMVAALKWVDEVIENESA
jgi:4-carboxymuconolactone decarboxylase